MKIESFETRFYMVLKIFICYRDEVYHIRPLNFTIAYTKYVHVLIKKI